MKKLYLLIAFYFFFSAVSWAQTPATVTIPNIQSNPNTDVSIPLNVTNFSNVGAINLVVNYDPNVLTFQSNPDPLAGTFIINEVNTATGKQIRIAWFSITPLNVPDGALLHLDFNYIGGSSNIDFDPSGNQIADANADVMSTTFNNGSITPVGVVATSSIGDYVWNDLNKDGLQDIPAVEPPLENITVKLYDMSTDPNATGSPLQTATTDAAGNYLFSNLPAGSYKVKFELLPGYEFTTKKANSGLSPDGDSDADMTTGLSDAITLAESEILYGVDAGMFVSTTTVSTVSIGDFVWDDANSNGIQDNNELGIKDVVVKLLDANNNDTELQSTITDAQGNYNFDNLTSGMYKLLFVLPADYVFSPKNANNSTNDNDSDTDPATSMTDAFTINTGGNSSVKSDAFSANSTTGYTITNMDCGMYKPTTPMGSIGDYVWNDLNKDGFQELKTIEPPLENVIVKLFNANVDPYGTGTPMQTDTTDVEGEYLFSGLSAGNYVVKFELLSGYKFSPKKANSGLSPDGDSDADVTTGLTDVITLGQNQILWKIDAGMYYKPVVTQAPDPWIYIDDYTTVAPDSGYTTTYTIAYANNGDADLINATIVDTIPTGLQYVSSSGGISSAETSYGSNVVIFQIGDVPAYSADSVFITVRVVTLESDYLMKACLMGEDSYYNNYQVCASDLNFCEVASGGGDAGLESNGDLASSLLKRQLFIRYGKTTPILAKSSANGIAAQHSLSEFYPATGPFNSQGTVTTPFDILGISNAVSSFAMDYNLNTTSGTRRVAGIFSTITEAPFIYDHTKALCDRLGGAAIEDIRLIGINGYKFYAAKLRNAKKSQTDYSISFSVYETSSGYQIQNKWTHGEYISPNGASSVYNFQVWSSSYDGTVVLVKNILSKFNSFNSVTYLNVNQLQPDVYVKSSYYSHDGTIHLNVVNLGNASQITIVNKYRISQSDVQVEETQNFTVQKGENDVVLSPGIISDANLSFTSSTGFKDETFVSGGAYTNISGPSSTVSSFSTANYPQPVVSNYADGSLLLSGGASITGSLSDWISVIRSFTASGDNVDLSNYSTVNFKAKGTGVLTLIFDLTNTENFNYFSYSINLSPVETEYSVNFSDLKELTPNQNQFDPRLVRNVGFILFKTKNPDLTDFNFEVRNIVFSTNLVTGIEDNNLAPKVFSLSQNYPNPFNPSTKIEFTVAKTGSISLIVYNILGQQVKVLVNNELNAGKHVVNFDASSLASGIYIYKLIGGSVNLTKKMILMK